LDAPSFAHDVTLHIGTFKASSEGSRLPVNEETVRRTAKKASARGRAKVGRAKRRSIQFVEHLTGDGPTVFDHVCRMGLEGIVSKRTDARYRSGPSRTWVKSKNPASAAVRREREEEWR
jgi:ATP-dependent DNA ligase